MQFYRKILTLTGSHSYPVVAIINVRLSLNFDRKLHQKPRSGIANRSQVSLSPSCEERRSRGIETAVKEREAITVSNLSVHFQLKPQTEGNASLKCRRVCVRCMCMYVLVCVYMYVPAWNEMNACNFIQTRAAFSLKIK